MTTTHDQRATPATGTARPPPRARPSARAELTLLVRNKAALTEALLLPLADPQHDHLPRTSTSPGRADPRHAGPPGAIGLALILAVYINLVGVYVIRREELVLKRLRTGELPDPEILAGTALPAG